MYAYDARRHFMWAKKLTGSQLNLWQGSGVNPNIFWGAIEAPKTPRGVGVERGRPLPTIFLILDLKMAICDACLVQFFWSSAKTLRGRKDTLAQVYFYWAGNRPPHPPGIDATAFRYVTLKFDPCLTLTLTLTGDRCPDGTVQRVNNVTF